MTWSIRRQSHSCRLPQQGIGSKAREGRGNSLFPAMLLMAFALAWSIGLTLWPRQDQAIAAIFPPDNLVGNALAAATAAGATEVLTLGGWPSVVIIRSNRPDIVSNLYHAGALIVIRAPDGSSCMPAKGMTNE